MEAIDRLTDRSTCRHGVESLVTLLPSTCDLVGNARQRIHPQRSGGDHRIGEARQFDLGDLSEPGEEEVQHLELVDTAAVPLIPRGVGRRRRSRITLEHRHVVTVVGQHHRCARSDDSATYKHDSSHWDPLCSADQP